MKNFSIIIPIYNESGSIFKLVEEIYNEFKNKSPEIVIVNDGSNDDFDKKIKSPRYKKVKIENHLENLGKCMAMLTGISAASNNLICVMDGDGQNPPYEVKKLIKFWSSLPKERKKKFLICGNRINRQDTLTKRISSKIANKVRKFFLDDDCTDTACALKVFLKNDYLRIKYFKNMHRFLPALFKMNDCRIYNIRVNDRPRNAGISKYSFNNRFWIGIIDLIKVWILIKKEKKNGE